MKKKHRLSQAYHVVFSMLFLGDGAQNMNMRNG